MKLILFFTRGVSLEVWLNQGLLEREKLIYEAHLEQGTLSEVVWLTYGSRDAALSTELHLAGTLDSRIKVVGMPRLFAVPKLGAIVYSLLMPLLNARLLCSADVLKTNQLDGAWAAIVGRWLSGTPVLVRSGYVQSQLERNLRRLSGFHIWFIAFLERLSLSTANRIVVAAPHNVDYLEAQQGVPRARQTVLPNFIDTAQFVPGSQPKSALPGNKTVYVGRFSPEKNLLELVRACAITEIGLDLVGAGPQKGEIEALATEVGCEVSFLGKVPNHELPALFEGYQLYVLPSLNEGMPKAIIEAMACGMVCVGTEVTGIKEIIEDGHNGFLSPGTDATALASTLERVTRLSAEARDAVAKQARADAVDRYSLAAVAAAEKHLLESMTQGAN
jgi:glycosyltransferase involved in cell wall biosynthesis